MHSTHHRVRSGGRYPVLRAIGIFYLIGAAVTAIAGIAGAVWMMVWAPAALRDRVSMGLGVLAATFFAVLAMLVIAEVIKLFIDVEHNTRLTASALASRGSPIPAGTVVAPDSPNLVGDGMHTNRMAAYLDDETAEAALIRGH
jgi:hypothetical protein